MELAALTGLERIAVIAGALVVGYWGYRMMSRERVPGLVFMGISCAVLGVVLITGNQRLTDVAAGVATPGTSLPEMAEAPVTSDQEAAPSDLSVDAEVAASEPNASAAAELPAIAETGTEPAAAPNVTEAHDADEAAASAAEDSPVEPARPVDELLSGQELGGRIVSIKSANVTLEWTPQSEE